MKNKIITIKRYICGYEEFDCKELFRNSKYEKEILPINVFLIEHRKFGNILINTGCSSVLKKNTVQYTKLKTQRKISFKDSDAITEQLLSEDIDPVCIKKVLLTHCDPECCGALPLLPRYELISTAQVLCVLAMALPAEGVMRSTLPEKNIKKSATGIFKGTTILRDYFKWIYDVLGDGSVLAVDLSGHAKAMTGFYLPEKNIFFAADAAIDERIFEENPVPTEKLLDLQYDADDYISTIMTLRRFHHNHPTTQLIFTHSQYDS